MKASTDKSELKRFLAMDMAERLIRVEQNVSSSFNQEVPYNKTAYYLSMTSEQKRDFEKFLKNKNKKRMMMFSLFFISLIGMSLLGSSITGSTILEQNSLNSLSFVEIFFFMIFGILFIYACYYFISKHLRHKKFEHHSEIIENIMLSKNLLN
jgi:uncharacterized membrane-anchored protein